MRINGYAVVITALVLMTSACIVEAMQEKSYPEADSPHFLYLPDKLDPAKVYWVVVGVHGAGGRNKGANGMSGWVDRKDDVIVIGPKFSDTYQGAGTADEELLVGLFKNLQQDYKVHPKMFIYGFSGGSQFGHRFVMKRPELVCGLSSHSGGSWATDGFGTINDEARAIPFAISCGGNDTGKAWGEAPYNRLEWYKRFEDAIAKKEFFYRSAVWTNAGHSASKGVHEMTEECFSLATQGMLPGSALAAQLQEAHALAIEGKFDEAQKLKDELSRGNIALPEGSGWRDNKESLAARKQLVTEALAQVDTSPAARQRFSLYARCVQLLQSPEKPNEDALLAFMQQCPPSYWTGRKDSSTVFEACNGAAASHVARLREQKKLTIPVYLSLLQAWDGLEIAKELLQEYDSEAARQLDKVLAMQKGPFRKNALVSFVRQWQVGKAVERARAELAPQPE
jgi:predicted esterase